MKRIAKTEKYSRRVGFWMDLDWGLKLELETYAGCQRYAREAGWRLVLDPSLKRRLPWDEGGARYDGILARVTQPVAEEADRLEVPVVNLWLNSPMLESVPSVVSDYEVAGVMAAEHLLGRGLRNFGYLGALKPKDSELQFRGFQKKVEDAGLPCSNYHYPHSIMEGDPLRWKKFGIGLEKWIDTWCPPMGIFVYQDVICRFLIDACTAKGLSVPGDVVIVGSADDTIICESSSPSLTSIDFGYERRGYEAAALLGRLMDGEAPPEKPLRVAPARLIPRQSSDTFAVSDVLVARALRFISKNSDRMLMVGEVASQVGVSRRTLERKFSASVGHSIADEMIRLRLNRAKRRLAEGKVALKTVAEESGFRSVSHFSRVFTRVLGENPSTFRSAHQVRTLD